MSKSSLMRPKRAQGDLFSETTPEAGAVGVRRPRGGSARTARLPTPLDVPASPFLKWAGGKGQLLSQLFPLMPAPEQIPRYHEPFIGGGAVFFALAPRRAVISDLNPELVTCYQVIRREVDALIDALGEHVYEKEHYYAVRSQDPESLTAVQRAARFIFLNRTCFNGLHRVNRKGQFNVPFGRHANPTICDEVNLRRVARALRHTEVEHAPFQRVLEHAREGDFVYFDPPYQPISATSSFTAYTSHAFGPAQQVELAQVFRALDARGCRVMLSNSNAEFIRALYAGFDIREVFATRAINRDATKRGPIAELVVRNFAR
jgi:DNA adenine methylase